MFYELHVYHFRDKFHQNISLNLLQATTEGSFILKQQHMDVQVKALVLNQIVTQWYVENPKIIIFAFPGLLQEVETI